MSTTSPSSAADPSTAANPASLFRCWTHLQLLKLSTVLTQCPKLLLLQLLDPSTADSLAPYLQLLDPITAAQCLQLPFFNIPLLTHLQLLPLPNLFRCWTIDSCYTASQCLLLPFFNLPLLTHPQLFPSSSLMLRDSFTDAMYTAAQCPLLSLLQLLTHPQLLPSPNLFSC